MSRNNKLRLTWISFFSYGLTGALVIITGVILNNIADYFQLSVSSMSNTFTFLNSGILAAIFLNVWLMEIIPLKWQLIFGFLLMMLAVWGLINGHSLTVFSLSMFILGIVSGITMSIGTYLITYLYRGRQLGSHLLITESFFSMSGIFFPMLAGTLLTHHIAWYWVYACINIIYVVIFVLTLLSDFPVLPSRTTSHILQTREPWGLGVGLLALAALCYILGQLSFISWVPEYAITHFQMNVQQAGGLISYFWTAYMIGIWVFSAMLQFFNLQRIITVLTALSAIFVYLFIHASDSTWLSWCLLATGFVSSAIYTSIITLGSQQTRVPSPRLVNFILTCGTIGTMLTFVLTSTIVANYGVDVAIRTSNLLYTMVFVLCLLLGFVSRHNIHT